MVDVSTGQEKLFAGARLRRLRKDLAQTQAQFAESLGVSPSYLNLLERNQRPVTARVLLALAQNFDVDVRAFGAETDRQLLTDLQEAVGDPILDGTDLDIRDLQDLMDSHPRAADALSKLYQAYRESNATAVDLAARVVEGGGSTGAGLSPLEEVRDALDKAQNHFPSLEEEADALRRRCGEFAGPIEAGLTERLYRRHSIRVRMYDDTVMGGALRRFDYHARKLLLSDHLSQEGRIFNIAATLILLECENAINAVLAEADHMSDTAKDLYRASLVSYGAAAIMMPYDAFQKAAEETRYDIEALSRKFVASYEQVCHRLTTLNRPGARGVSFFLIRIDQAGNVSKRFGGGVIPFARSGGSCARWGLHEAFRVPERVLAQAIELPDGAQYITLAKAVARPNPGGQPHMNVIAVGCDASHAARLAYPIEIEDPNPVGLNCRLCERTHCAQRAFPPLQRKIRVDDHVRGASPFAFGED